MHARTLVELLHNVLRRHTYKLQREKSKLKTLWTKQKTGLKIGSIYQGKVQDL